MKQVSDSKFRSDMGNLLDKVHEDHAPLRVTRHDGASIVVLSLEDFTALQEAASLHARPQDTKSVDTAILEINNDGDIQRKLINEMRSPFSTIFGQNLDISKPLKKR